METFKIRAGEHVSRVRSRLEKMIPIKPKSFEEFISIMERERASRAEAQVLCYSDYASTGMGGAWGMTGGVNIGIGLEAQFKSITPKGRKIVHREYYGYLPVKGNDPAVNIAIFRALVTAERRLQQLQGVDILSTELIGPDGRIEYAEREGLREEGAESVPSLTPMPDYLLVENKVLLNKLE